MVSNPEASDNYMLRGAMQESELLQLSLALQSSNKYEVLWETPQTDDEF